MLERQVIVMAMTTLLVACSASRPAPIDDRARSVREPDSELRTVVRGDTLYSIAWESGRDFRELAAWNRIAPPYTLHPGQELRVKPPEGGVATSAAAAPEAVPEKRLPAPPAPPAKKPVPKKPVPTEQTKSAPAPRKPPQGADAKPPAPSTTGATAGSVAWDWPAPGKVVSRFSDSGGNKGIDIGGATGSPVMAAAPGRIVYQGSGLRGYGRLIIVKHNDEFLSAYAHNDNIYVKEGDTVKRGQKIASMGTTGTDRVKLHFEIRRNGVPVDPLRYLPKR